MDIQNQPATIDDALIKLMQERALHPEEHPGCGLFEIINYKPYDGDTKHMWDRNNPDEVEAAKTMFETFKKKKYAIFATDKNGEKGEQVREFNAMAERYIFVPPMQGG